MEPQTENTSTGSVQVCQNCKTDFTIEPEDFSFYEKISTFAKASADTKVPPPTWCPECRMVRRMAWRNERTLHKRACDASGHDEMLVSIYAPDSPMTVYDAKTWWSDSWDSNAYACEYDFAKNFFVQFCELLSRVPSNNLLAESNSESDYVNFQTNSRRCYLVFGGANNEDVLFSTHGNESRNTLDAYFFTSLESCYDTTLCRNSFKLRWSDNSSGCAESYFLSDCRNCQNCVGCVGLRNKQYHIFNTRYTKEEYENMVREFALDTWSGIRAFRERFAEFKKRFPHKYANTMNTENVSGDNISDAKNIHHVFDTLPGGSEDSKFCFWSGAVMKDVYDGTGVGVKSEVLYEGVSVALGNARVFFSMTTRDCRDTYYSFNCHNSANLFACVGLRNKQYCVLNKQYTKEEYEEMVPKIIKHMNDMPYVDQKGRVYTYGEFFPPELSPFAYNETIAQEYFPLTKEEAIEKGYKWRDPDTKQYTVTLKPEDLPDRIKDVPDTITNEVIGCAHAYPRASASGPLPSACTHQCTTAFKIIPQELAFYRKMNLPLPRLCPNCRHYERLAQRNPLKLWHRRCQCAGAQSSNGVYANTTPHTHGEEPCPTEFETSYAPDRPEIVYCESCYNAEVA